MLQLVHNKNSPGGTDIFHDVFPHHARPEPLKSTGDGGLFCLWALTLTALDGFAFLGPCLWSTMETAHIMVI